MNKQVTRGQYTEGMHASRHSANLSQVKESGHWTTAGITNFEIAC